MRSTPTPYETFRTVKVELKCPRLRRMTTPSKIWMRSLSPSLILVCTRTVSPTRNCGSWARTSGLTFRSSTSSIAFERIFDSSCSDLFVYRSPKNRFPSSLFAGKVRSALARPRQRLLFPPLGDLCVIAREKDFWHFQPAKLGGAGVVRALEEPLAEALDLDALRVAHHPGHQPRHGVDHRQRGELAAGEHEIAEGNLLVDEGDDPLVHALVAAADEDQLLAPRELLRERMVESAALRGHEDHVRAGETLARRLDGGDQRLGLHHHACAAAVGNVVGDAVLARGEFADVRHLHAHQ